MAIHTSKQYDKDFYAWTLQSAQLLRQGKFSEVDIKNLAEEIESIGKSDKRELIKRCAVLLSHLLKWQYQPERRGNSWKHTLKNQRLDIKELLTDSPSLRYELNQQLDYAYEKALNMAVEETGLREQVFPESCPFSVEQMLDHDFLSET